MDWSLYAALINANGETEREEMLQDTKDYFIQNAVNNLGYNDNVIYNCTDKRRFIIQRSESYNKVKVTAFPDEPLYSGDILQCGDEILLITGTYLLNDVQVVGTAWICNIKLRFQNNTADIIEIPAALDDGTYSATVGEEKGLQYLNKKLRIYLPYNNNTKLIYIDKRFGVETVCDKYMNKQMAVYKVAGINHASVNFGKGAHLLELTVESDQYSPSNDNLDNMICDYISPTDTPIASADKLKCEIKGRPTILLDNSRLYTPIFYDKDGNEVGGVVPSWNLTAIEGITLENIDNKANIIVGNSDDLIGITFTLTLQDKNGLYESCSMEIEVTV